MIILFEHRAQPDFHPYHESFRLLGIRPIGRVAVESHIGLSLAKTMLESMTTSQAHFL
jgi:hypothetical protein